MVWLYVDGGSSVWQFAGMPLLRVKRVLAFANPRAAREKFIVILLQMGNASIYTGNPSCFVPGSLFVTRKGMLVFHAMSCCLLKMLRLPLVGGVYIFGQLHVNGRSSHCVLAVTCTPS